MIWCTKDPNAHIRTFCKHWRFIWRYLFPVSILKPLSYCFKETVGFDVKASFASPPVLSLVKPGDITKEFQEKVIQFHGTFQWMKITNCIMPDVTMLGKGATLQNTWFNTLTCTGTKGRYLQALEKKTIRSQHLTRLYPTFVLKYNHEQNIFRLFQFEKLFCNILKIFILYFYDAYDVNMWVKIVRHKYGLFMQNECLYRISPFYEKRSEDKRED